ncbi:hypothetical protein ACP8Y2_11315 [Herpetosiphon llansteffanensis]
MEADLSHSTPNAELLEWCYAQAMRLQHTTIIDAWPLALWQALLKTKPSPWVLEQIDYVSDPLQQVRIYSFIWPKLTPDQQATLTVQLEHSIANIDALGTRITAIGLIQAHLPQKCAIWLHQTLDVFETAGKLQHQTDCLSQIMSLNLDRDLHRGLIERVHSLLLQLPPNHSTEQLLGNLINYHVACADFEQARPLAELLEQTYNSPYGWNVISKAWLASGNSAQQLLDWYSNHDQSQKMYLLIMNLLKTQRLNEALAWLAQYPQLNNHAHLKPALVAAYLTHERLAEAAAIAITIPQPWIYSHPIEDVIKAYVLCGDSEQALALARSIDSPWQQIRGLVTIFINDSQLEFVQFSILFAEAYAHIAKLSYPFLKTRSLFSLAFSCRLLAEQQISELIAAALELAELIDDDDDYDKVFLGLTQYLINRGQPDLAETMLLRLREIELIETKSGALTQAYLDAGRFADAVRLARGLNQRAAWEQLIAYSCEHNQLEAAIEFSKNRQNPSHQQAIYLLLRGLMVCEAALF